MFHYIYIYTHINIECPLFIDIKINGKSPERVIFALGRISNAFY